MIKIACQTIVYGNSVIKDNIEGILRNIAEIGYDGVEIGARHFYLDRPGYYAELLEKHRLELPAIHVGGDFLNRESVAEQLEGIARTIQFARGLGCGYIYLSGACRKGKTDADYLHEARTYEEIGRRCAAEGLTLCYHNHDWEIANNLHGLALLLNNVSGQYMRLAPDVGWIAVAGADPLEFLKNHEARIEALHFKDFRNRATPRTFTELGTGIVDFKAVYDYFKAKRDVLWITAEQDEATNTPQESAKANYAYIRALADSVSG